MYGSFLIGGGVLAAAGLGLRRWYRSCDWLTAEDERHVARTADGWNLGLYRYRPRGTARGLPVLLGHGMAGSRLIFDLHPDYSLARFLAAGGLDTWLVDLRGRQRSWPDGGPHPALQWNFDDFVERDLPAAVERVSELTRAPAVHWVGMEMSGQALYAAAIAGTAARIGAGVTCGAPVRTPPTALVPGVTSAPRTRRRGRVPFGSGARLAGPVLAYARARVLESSFRPCNTDPVVVARYFRNGVPDEATDLVDQFTTWIHEGRMRSRDGSRVYSERLGEVRLPLLLLAAERDLQRPADAVRETSEAMGSADRTFVRAGVATGFSVDYGHDDLLAGRASPREVFPLVRDWLLAHA